MLALPEELSRRQNIDLVRRFAQRTFADAGMVVDVGVRLVKAKAEPSPMASLLATTRTLVAGDAQPRFGNKVTLWKTGATLLAWRAAWVAEVNASLAAGGSTDRVDHRSMAAQRLDAESRTWVGVIGRRRYGRRMPSGPVLENKEGPVPT